MPNEQAPETLVGPSANSAAPIDYARIHIDEPNVSEVHDQSIGDLLCRAGKLNDAQVRQVLEHQSKHGGRFGDAAIALGLLKRADVLWALSQQFDYPYAGQQTSGEHHGELFMANEPFGDEVEAFRDLRSQLVMGVLAPSEARRALTVVSPNIGDGKTFLTANLAVAFSQLPGRTLVVDGDMRSPRMHAVFGIENNSGLSNILSGRAEPNVIRPVQDLQNLYMLPAGTVPPNPLELVQGRTFSALIAELNMKFDYVLIDTPAAEHGSDGRVIAARTGLALFVGRKGRSSSKSAERLIGQLNKAAVTIAGVVMNDA